MKLKKVLTAGLPCLLWLAAVIEGRAQVASNAQAGCSRVDQSRPAQYISFEAMSDSNARLRLHNNSSCPILVETDDRGPLLLGGVRHAGVHYLLHDRRRQTVRPGYGWGDSVFTVEVAGGDSVMFLVPAVHFKRRLDVAVPFTYSWEGDHVGAGLVGGVSHYVYFLREDVRVGARGRK